MSNAWLCDTRAKHLCSALFELSDGRRILRKYHGEYFGAH
jgi:hypothetical protein